MKIDAADKVMLSRYLNKKDELFQNEVQYCENLIKKIIKEIIKKVYQRVKYPYSVDFEKIWGDYMVKLYTNDYQLINE